MDSKVFWFDTETTGIDPYHCCVITLAAIIEVNGKVLEEIDLRFKPHDGARIDEAAIKTHGISREQMNEFEPAPVVLAKLKSTLSEIVNKFDKNDKLIMAGYNVKFDADFLRQMFMRSGDKYFGSFFFWPTLDVQHYVACEIIAGLRLPNFKLSTVAKHYNIEIDAHDALSDIRATKRLYEILR